MSIQSEITRISNGVSAAKTAIASKGGTVSSTSVDDLATEIATIPSGGGADPTFFGCTEGIAEMNYLENIMPELLVMKFKGELA